MIYAISDLHLSSAVNKPMNIFGGNWENYWDDIKADWQSRVKSDDLVLIAGDISWAMRLEDAVPDLKDIAALNGKKVIIKGNHEYWWNSYSKVKAALPDSVYAIQNDALKLNGVIIAGTRGWSVPDRNSTAEDIKIYEREKLRLKLTLDFAARLRADGEDIYFMTHYPPFNANGDDSDFTEIISRYPVKCAVYGHLHGRDARARFELKKNGITYYLTSCDLVGNKLIELF
ncbi:MAG: metallophosphoesterase [Clostridiales bacterium]|jgi:predicted phosphohydrolase|nr:metallophosphoesterase [Clostridiales bacterium]